MNRRRFIITIVAVLSILTPSIQLFGKDKIFAKNNKNKKDVPDFFTITSSFWA